MNIELESIIKSYLDWDLLSTHQKMSISFMEKFKKYINWNLVLQYQKLDENIIRHFINDLNRVILIQYQKLSDNFIIDYLKILDIDMICKYQILPDCILNNPVYEKDLDWKIISKYQPVDKIKNNKNLYINEFIRRPLAQEIIFSIFKTLSDRQKKIICKVQNLNNDILFDIDFSFYIDTILKHQNLSEYILQDMIYFYDNIDFDIMRKYQKLSNEFIQRYKSKFIA